MSIRAKILAILLCSLVMAFVVSMLAYYQTARLEEEVGIIIDRTLPAARAARGVNDEVEAVRQSEERMVSVDDASWRALIDESLDETQSHITAGRLQAASATEEQDWTELAAMLRELRRAEVRLADMIGTEVREIQGQQRRLDPRMVRLRRGVGAICAELEQELLERTTDPGGAPELVDRYRRAARAGRDLAELLGELEDIKYSASDYEVFATDIQRQGVTRRLQSLARLVAEFEDALAETPRSQDGAASVAGSAALTGDLEEVYHRIYDVNGRLVAVREDTRLARERLVRKADWMQRGYVDQTEAQRASLVQRKSRVGALIVILLIFSVVFVGGLTMAVIRSISNKVIELLRASRRLQKGDLEARVQITGKDELYEVGNSFNAMAQYLQVRRKRQNDYNEIVTVLNSSIGVKETLTDCLGEVVERTGSNFGAIYLHDEATGALNLAEHHGLAAKASARRRIEVGEGLVGQVAKTRRMAVVRPVPAGAFELDLGVGSAAPSALLVLPLVHLEVVLGVIVLGSAADYVAEDIRFVEEVVFQVAVAISNAIFYQTIERTAEALRENHDKLIAQQHDLERVNKRLEEANRLKSEFLANVTHELRTPLNSIIGFTDLVLDSDNLVARQDKNLRTVLRNADNLLRLINDLLDIAKMESGTITLSLEHFDAVELIEEAVEMVRPLVGHKQIAVHTRLASSLPTMYSDRVKTKQIIVNLLSNAVKFTESGTIVVEAEVRGDRVAIHVRDSGIGMRPEDLAVIFDKFRQVDGSSSRKYGGTGLGLAITRQLCTFLGGEVSAASMPNEGSTFTVTLPIHFGGHAPAMDADGLVQIDADGDARLADRWEGEGGKPFLLVIDDDPSSVVLLREGLSKEGIEVKSAFTAQDAVDILRAFKPLCVVIGAALPDEDGSSAMSEVWGRIKDDGVPVLLIWDGEGVMPLYGYPTHADKLEAGWTSDLSDRTIARVIDRIERPVGAPQLLRCLLEHRLIPKSEEPGTTQPGGSP